MRRPPKPKKKHRLVEVTDATEIAAIQRGEWGDPMGGELSGKWYAERKTLDAYRARFSDPAGERQP